MGVLSGVVTFIALITFLGIVWWAFSRGRKKANEDAAMLPFDLPDEGEVDLEPNKQGAEGVAGKKQGESDE